MSQQSLSTLQILSAFPITGVLGIDRFYQRQILIGFLKMFTMGGFGLWYIIDALCHAAEGITGSTTTITDSTAFLGCRDRTITRVLGWIILLMFIICVIVGVAYNNEYPRVILE